MRTPPSSTIWLRADEIRVDPETQRSIRPSRVKYLADNFNAERLGIIHVSHRKAGWYVIDGQHRIMACRLRGEADRRLECKPHENLTRADEARTFQGLNDQLNVRYFDDFRVRLTWDPVAIDIEKLIEAVGLKISDQALDGHLTAVKACEDLYRGKVFRATEPTPWALARTLRTLTNAWQSNRDAVAGPMIVGVGAVHLRYGDAVDVDVLARKLAKFDGGPVGVFSRAKIRREMTKSTVWRAVAEVVVDIYNKGMRRQALPSFVR